MVKPKAGADLGSIHAQNNASIHRVYGQIGHLQVVTLPPGTSVAATVAAYRASGQVEYAEPDSMVRIQLEPDDTHFLNNDQWNLKNVGQYGGTPGADIHAPLGWAFQHDASNIIVAIVDTGIRLTHEDLAPNLWVNAGESATLSANEIDDDGDGYVDDVHGINAITGSGSPDDDHGHGTHVAGIIGAAGNNVLGITGVAWKVQLMACKCFDANGNALMSDIIECIDYARRKGAKIINASWGDSSFNSQALYDAIDAARRAGIIFVTVAANHASNNDVSPVYPANFHLDNIVVVAATDRNDNLAFFSDYGATTVDLAAPGSPVFSCWNGSDSDYRYLDGTSMAAPHVSGACALIWARYPWLSYQVVLLDVFATVDRLPSLVGKTVTGGRLNIATALGWQYSPKNGK